MIIPPTGRPTWPTSSSSMPVSVDLISVASASAALVVNSSCYGLVSNAVLPDQGNNHAFNHGRLLGLKVKRN